MEARRRDYVAAARALPSLDDLLALRRQKLDDVGTRLGRSLTIEVSRKRAAYSAPAMRLVPPLLTRGFALRHERLAGLSGRARQAHVGTLRHQRRALIALAARHDIAGVQRIVSRQRERFEQSARLMRSYSYEAVLDRGFALVLGPAGQTVRSPDQVAAGDQLTIRVAQGEIGAAVTKADAKGGAERPKRPKPASSGPGKPGQGSLF